MSDTIVQADNLVKIYKTSDLEVMALSGLDLTVERGELTAIIGSSGSGKSTFLNMLGGLDRPTAGRLYVAGNDLFSMNEKQLNIYKRDTVGFVWQNNGRNLLPFLTSLENVMLPMRLRKTEGKKEKALKLLDMVGLKNRANSRLSELSGGEQQRIAIAIALSNEPQILLADEPTGSVDRKTADYIFDIFKEFNRELNQTIIIVTHDVSLSKKVKRVVAIRDGKIASERILKDEYVDVSSGVDWLNEATQEEFAIVDRAGRIQMPQEFMERLKLSSNKVIVSMENDRIIIEKPGEDRPKEAQ